jgi:hypothetical protein
MATAPKFCGQIIPGQTKKVMLLSTSSKIEKKVDEAIGLLDQEDAKTKIVSKQYLIESEFGPLQATAD